MKTKTSILIADDHALMREGLKQIIELEDDMNVIGLAVDGEDAVSKVQKLKPDVVLLDINMPKMNGIQALRRLKDMGIDSKVIMLTFHEEREYLFQTMNMGASGYMIKDTESDILVKAIRDVAKGYNYVHPSLSKVIHFKENDKKYEENKKNKLTRREYEVLELIADGKNNKEIAKDLFISEKTVKNHVSNIFKKLEVNDRTQAAIYAYKNNIKPI
ncbi:MAG: response regulator transcription factor [Anaeromicrobium sp.]|jgi:DNA-binding NarL/FixJ family response regulator|uniref:response regulator n=1 Tax=Anaeromicrobium sp. TaxID=1929132 RepID=UPI0025DDD334|nr:response regulator transcription factor [Anaeromicrobium sp.]MCT4595945.1 response regulator transcription factor [Anaeromicrobium sp.]